MPGQEGSASPSRVRPNADNRRGGGGGGLPNEPNRKSDGRMAPSVEKLAREVFAAAVVLPVQENMPADGDTFSAIPCL